MCGDVDVPKLPQARISSPTCICGLGSIPKASPSVSSCRHRKYDDAKGSKTVIDTLASFPKAPHILGMLLVILLPRHFLMERQASQLPVPHPFQSRSLDLFCHHYRTTFVLLPASRSLQQVPHHCGGYKGSPAQPPSPPKPLPPTCFVCSFCIFSMIFMCTSKYLAVHLSRQTPSPLLRSPSR